MQLQTLLESVQDLLDEHGIVANIGSSVLEGGETCRMICVTDDLGVSRSKLKDAARDHVVMVRVDEGTIGELDAWIKTGVASSRSEAAALFIREGLKLRNQELDELRESIHAVELAQAKLEDKAKTILGGGDQVESEKQ